MLYYVITAIIIAIAIFFYKELKPKSYAQPDEDSERKMLNEHVDYFKKLSPGDQDEFLKRVKNFLKKVNIVGVNTEVTDLDRVLVGASAIIPIRHFPNWEYTKLHEVLLYPSAFDSDFCTRGSDKHIVGMVGTGAMNNAMILSRPFLESGYSQKHSNSNTGIHEFVHLIDRVDGETDGDADVLMDHRMTKSWEHLVDTEIAKIKSRHSEIDPYAATNHAEFFAVVSEYYFKNPNDLKKHHPELFQRLDDMYHNRQVTA